MKVYKYLESKLKRLLLGSSEKYYFNSIDVLPIYNWFKLNETGDTKYLHRKLKENDNHELWQHLTNEMVQLFGFSDTFQEEIMLRKKIALLEIKAAKTGDKMIINVINLHKAELEELKSKEIQEDIDYFEQIAQLEDLKGRNIDEHKTSTRKYYTYIKGNGRKNNKEG